MSEVEFNKNLQFRNINRFSDEFENSKKLPVFKTQEEADEYFIRQKQEGLDIFSHFLNEYKFFKPDYSPESLKSLELLYFDLYENQKFTSDFITIEDFELFMSLYFGEVMVRHSNSFKWGAEKHFLTNNAYYLAITKKLMSIAISRLKDYYNTRNNKTKQSLYRKFKRFSN